MEEEQEREFKGVWIPSFIWLDDRLTAIEKFILIEINSLDTAKNGGCTASNTYIAKFCQCSETKVSTAISKLVELGYIYIENFNGRIRVLKSRLSNFERQGFNFLKADSQILKPINIDNNIIENIKENTLKEKRKAVIQDIFDFWNSSGIIKHLHLNDKIYHQIEIALQTNSPEEIKTCIKRYGEVVNDKTYYFNQRWTLVEFLKQGNAMTDFKDDGSKWVNYKNSKPKTAEDVTKEIKETPKEKEIIKVYNHWLGEYVEFER